MVGVNIGYLICRNCKGYYQLEEEESPDDFDSCQCGGKLVHTYHFESLPTILAFADMDEEQQKKLNEILDLEQAMQNRGNTPGKSQNVGSLFNRQFNRGMNE